MITKKVSELKPGDILMEQNGGKMLAKETKKLVVKVTQKHIDSGIRGACHCCPIALALQESTGRFWSVYTNAAYYHVSEVPLPESAVSFIKCFDEGLRVEPFEFELEY